MLLPFCGHTDSMEGAYRTKFCMVWLVPTCKLSIIADPGHKWEQTVSHLLVFGEPTAGIRSQIPLSHDLPKNSTSPEHCPAYPGGLLIMSVEDYLSDIN